MGTIGQNLHRLHQPAGALAQLGGMEVGVRCIRTPATTTPLFWRLM